MPDAKSLFIKMQSYKKIPIPSHKNLRGRPKSPKKAIKKSAPVVAEADMRL